MTRRKNALRALRGFALAASLLAPSWAEAQLGGSVVVESDYRFRGVSLSSERPNLRLTLSLDHASGAYGGVSASGVEFERGRRLASLLSYAGFSAPFGTTLRWDIGATYTHAAGDARYDYGEAYAGLIGERWSLRAYLAPDYFGSGARTAYAELDAGWPLGTRRRLFAHLGALRRLGAPSSSRVDVRAGAGWRIGEGELQLAWVGVQRSGPFATTYDQRRNTLVLSASYAF